MSLNSAVPVRFDAVQVARLAEISRRHGIPVAQLIRWATEKYLEEVEKSGELVVPKRDVQAQAQKNIQYLISKRKNGPSGLNDGSKGKGKS